MGTVARLGGRSSRIWHKLAAIALTLIVPLALTTYFLIGEARVRIDFAEKEIQGVQYLRPLSALLVDVSLHRSLARRSLIETGSTASGSEVAVAAAAVDNDFRELARVDEQLGRALRTSRRDLDQRHRARSVPALLSTDWATLGAKVPDLPTSEALHTDLIVRIRGLISHIGDTSQLILDPDLDTYYVMDALLLKEPELIDQLR